MSGTSTRCFVAVLLPERVRAGLAAVSAELRGQTRGLSWVREDNLHLTLRFLGDVEPAMLPHVRTAVMTVAAAAEPFTVGLSGLGGFPARRPPRVLRANAATGGGEMVALYERPETALAARGILRESRPFPPHVPLARVRAPRGAGRIAKVLGAGPPFGEVQV